MKTLTLALVCMITLLSCNKENMTTNEPRKGPTKILGKVTIVNSDIPVDDIDVYIWKYSDEFGAKRELVDETVSDSNGNFELNFDVDRSIKLSANFNHTPYLTYRHSQDPTFELDGKTHQVKIEMIPPAWVNVRMIDKNNFSGYDMIGVGSKNFSGGGWNIYGPKDSTILVKVYGNMQDTISFSYFNELSNPYRFERIKSLKFPVFVPPFQVQEMTIEY
jgi:hypothetical protein